MIIISNFDWKLLFCAYIHKIRPICKLHPRIKIFPKLSFFLTSHFTCDEGGHFFALLHFKTLQGCIYFWRKLFFLVFTQKSRKGVEIIELHENRTAKTCKTMFWGRIFGQAGKSSFLARSELYNDCPLYLVPSCERARSQPDKKRPMELVLKTFVLFLTLTILTISYCTFFIIP